MTERAAPAIEGFTDARYVADGEHGTVWHCRQVQPDREVAIKVCPAGLAPDSGWRFERAVRALTSLAGQVAVIDLYAAGTLPEATGSRPGNESAIGVNGSVATRPGYLVLPWCPSDLSRELDRPFALPEVLELGIRLAGALESAHRRGIVHREVTPGHVLLTPYGRPVLTGFGASVTSRPPGSARPWAAPETLTSEPSAGAASDCYSLAAVLLTLLEAGVDDAAGDRADACANAKARANDADADADDGPPASVPSVGPAPWAERLNRHDLPPALADALRRAIDPDPLRRFASMADFAAALLLVQDDQRLPATDLELLGEVRESASAQVSAGPAGESGLATRVSKDTATGRSPATARRRRRRLRLVGAGGFALLAAAGIWLAPLLGPKQHGATPSVPAAPNATAIGDLIPTEAPTESHAEENTATASAAQAPDLPANLWAMPMSGASISYTEEDDVAIVFGLSEPKMTISFDPAVPAPQDCRITPAANNNVTVTWQAPGARTGDVYLAWQRDTYKVLQVPETSEFADPNCLNVVTLRPVGGQRGLVSAECRVCWGQ